MLSGTDGSSYTCSNSYASETASLALCPFDPTKCGSNEDIAFNGSAPGESYSVSMNIPLGETCTYEISSRCGLPTFTPYNDTTGFDIQMLEYDENDLKN